VNRYLVKIASYREGGSVTHMGRSYSLDSLLTKADSVKAREFPISDLEWSLGDEADPARVEKADLSTPGLVTRLPDGRLVTLDGYHRLNKAKKEGKTGFLAKELPGSLFTY